MGKATIKDNPPYAAAAVLLPTGRSGPTVEEVDPTDWRARAVPTNWRNRRIPDRHPRFLLSS